MTAIGTETGDGGQGGLTRDLVRRVRGRAVEAGDLQAAERYFRDWLASAVAGRAPRAGRILLEYGREVGGLEGRVFVAGGLSHVTESDDLHAPSTTHPGTVVFPVALVLSRHRGARGPALLEAALAGYEVITRIGEALGPGHYRIFHNTATAGVFGAAAAAAHLLGLDEDGWTWALGSAGTQAAGLWQFNQEGAMSKPLHAGHAAAAGLRSTLLAARGFTGAERILEGERGLFAGLCPDPDPGAVLREADGWKLHETSLKPYPCCRHVHPAIDAALELRAAPEGLDPAGIEHVRIGTYDAARERTDRPRPGTPHDARFSIQYCVASTLLHGAPTLSTFQSGRVPDPAVAALLDRVTVEGSPELDAAYPARWGARLEVELASGRRREARREVPRGSPADPLSDGELDDKVRRLMEFGGLDADEAAELVARSRALPSGGEPPPLPGLA